MMSLNLSDEIVSRTSPFKSLKGEYFPYTGSSTNKTKVNKYQNNDSKKANAHSQYVRILACNQFQRSKHRIFSREEDTLSRAISVGALPGIFQGDNRSISQEKKPIHPPTKFRLHSENSDSL
jgi:hypothetical protein